MQNRRLINPGEIMPYSHKKLPNGKVEVYKTDTGEKVGITTPGKLSAYLAALHANAPESHMDKGGEVDEIDALLEEAGLKPSANLDKSITQEYPVKSASGPQLNFTPNMIEGGYIPQKSDTDVLDELRKQEILHSDGGEISDQDAALKMLARKDADYFRDRIAHHEEVNKHSEDSEQIKDNESDIARMKKELEERMKMLEE